MSRLRYHIVYALQITKLDLLYVFQIDVAGQPLRPSGTHAEY